jgi:hypothetical protein
VVTRSAQVSLVTGDCLRRQRRASYGSQPSYELQRLARDEGDAVGNRHALRGACSLAAHALAAQMARFIALAAPAALGSCGDPVHEPMPR